jgi:hypothetical protein
MPRKRLDSISPDENDALLADTEEAWEEREFWIRRACEMYGADYDDEAQRHMVFGLLAINAPAKITVDIDRSPRPKGDRSPRGESKRWSSADLAVLRHAKILAAKEGSSFDSALRKAIAASPKLAKHADPTTHPKRLKRLNERVERYITDWTIRYVDLKANVMRWEGKEKYAEARGSAIKAIEAYDRVMIALKGRHYLAWLQNYLAPEVAPRAEELEGGQSKGPPS